MSKGRARTMSPLLIAFRITTSMRCLADAAPKHCVYPQSRKVRAERAEKSYVEISNIDMET